MTTPAATIIMGMAEPILAPVPKIVACGDIHGDLTALVAILMRANIMNTHAHWIGGRQVLILVGDLIDDGGRFTDETNTQMITFPTRGDEELRIFELLLRLKYEAQEVGGNVRVAIGNHEAYLFMGEDWYMQPTTSTYYGGQRVQLFAPGSPLCHKLANLLEVIVIEGRNVFCHGGVTEKNIRSMDDIVALNQRLPVALKQGGDAAKQFFKNLTRTSSPLMVRDWGVDVTRDTCKRLEDVRRAIGKYIPRARFFIGHSVQENGINSICDDGVDGPIVYRLDVMMSRAFGPKLQPTDRLEYINVINDDVYVTKF